MTSDLLIVTAPKPPGSRQLISPPAAVFEIAPAKVLQGAVRLHGLASSPTPETHVRVAWACAGVVLTTPPSIAPRKIVETTVFSIVASRSLIYLAKSYNRFAARATCKGA